MRAVKAQASLCIGKNSTEPSLFENATNTKYPDFFLSFNASSESSGWAVHWHPSLLENVITVHCEIFQIKHWNINKRDGINDRVDCAIYHTYLIKRLKSG